MSLQERRISRSGKVTIGSGFIKYEMYIFSFQEKAESYDIKGKNEY